MLVLSVGLNICRLLGRSCISMHDLFIWQRFLCTLQARKEAGARMSGLRYALSQLLGGLCAGLVAAIFHAVSSSKDITYSSKPSEGWSHIGFR